MLISLKFKKKNHSMKNQKVPPRKSVKNTKLIPIQKLQAIFEFRPIRNFCNILFRITGSKKT